MKNEYLEDIEQRWGYEGMEVGYSCDNFVGKWEELVSHAFGDSEPVKRAYDGSDMTRLIELYRQYEQESSGSAGYRIIIAT